MSLSHLSIRMRLVILVSVFVVGLASFAFLAGSTLSKVKINGPLYKQIVEGKDIIADVLPPPEYIVETYLNVFQTFEEKDPAEVKQLIDRGKVLRDEYNERHEYWIKELADGDIKRLLVEESYGPAVQFYDTRDHEFVPAVLAGDTEGARKILEQKLKPYYDAHRARIDQVVLKATQRNQHDEQSAAALIGWRTLLMLIAGIGALAIGIVIAMLTARGYSKVLGSLFGELRRLTDAAVQGKLQTRGNPQAVTFEFRPIVEGVNATLDAVVGPLTMSAAYMDRISKGDIPPEITDEYHGDFNRIKNSLNQCIGALSGLIAEMTRMSDEHNAGDIDAVIAADKFQGAYRDMAKGINEMVEGHITVNRKAMACIAEFGKGNFEAPLEKFPGKKAFINDTIEQVRANLNNVTADAIMLADAADEGRLNARADESKYADAWQRIIRGMNKTLEGFAVPMRDIGQVLTCLAAKDFSHGIQNEYPGAYGELCTNVNLVVESICGAIEQIAESADQFTEGSRIISQSAQTQASGAQEQSSSVQQITASVEELSRSVDGVKINAQDADSVSKETSQLAEEGGLAVRKSAEAMEQIKASSDQIAEIIQVISEIAGQTNLLALNAAIEAARAGEHGMGFAVVADEVRKLAERSNQAAGEITKLIKESALRVHEGAQLSQDTEESFKRILAGVQNTTAKIGEIAAATVQQASNAEEVSRTIQGVAQITEQAAAGSEEMASSSEELGAQAQALRDLVGQFATDNKHSDQGRAVEAGAV